MSTKTFQAALNFIQNIEVENPMKKLSLARFARSTKLPTALSARIVFTLIHANDNGKNYQLLSLIATRMSNENRGSEVSLSRNHNMGGRLELTMKLPRKFWSSFETRREIEVAYRKMAREYKVELAPYFK
jgi:hypothetical protein